MLSPQPGGTLRNLPFISVARDNGRRHQLRALRWVGLLRSAVAALPAPTISLGGVQLHWY